MDQIDKRDIENLMWKKIRILPYSILLTIVSVRFFKFSNIFIKNLTVNHLENKIDLHKNFYSKFKYLIILLNFSSFTYLFSVLYIKETYIHYNKYKALVDQYMKNQFNKEEFLNYK